MNKKVYILIFVIAVFFSDCKKYPENTLWFKNIKKINFFDNVKLTGFTVNGIDSLYLLGSYFGSNVPDKDINNTFFQPIGSEGVNFYGQAQFIVSAPGGLKQTLGVGYTYSKNKKNIALGWYNIDTSLFKKNLFIDNSEWQIMKLNPKGTRKIKKTVNGNTYELQFDKQ